MRLADGKALSSTAAPPLVTRLESPGNLSLPIPELRWQLEFVANVTSGAATRREELRSSGWEAFGVDPSGMHFRRLINEGHCGAFVASIAEDRAKVLLHAFPGWKLLRPLWPIPARCKWSTILLLWRPKTPLGLKWVREDLRKHLTEYGTIEYVL